MIKVFRDINNMLTVARGTDEYGRVGAGDICFSHHKSYLLAVDIFFNKFFDNGDI
jgi:hypothetical protein